LVGDGSANVVALVGLASGDGGCVGEVGCIGEVGGVGVLGSSPQAATALMSMMRTRASTRYR
jgi:hypothetical protein